MNREQFPKPEQELELHHQQGHHIDSYDDYRRVNDARILMMSKQMKDSQYQRGVEFVDARWSLYDFATTPFIMDELIAQRLNLQGHETVIDVGCGNATMLRALRSNFGHEGPLIGIDPYVEVIKKARRRARFKGVTDIDFIVGKGEELPLADNSVDAAMSLFMLYHVDPPERGLEELYRVLKPGGTLIVATSAAGNKARQRQLELDIANYLGIAPPPIFAAPFYSEIAEELLPQLFSIEYHEQQHGRLRIDNENKFQEYLSGLATMRNVFTPSITDEQWAQAIWSVVIPAFKAALDSQPMTIASRDVDGKLSQPIEEERFFVDIVQRDFYTCRPKK